MGRRSGSDVHGVLVVDKPTGPTSHDVVGWARRALGTRAIGHAGTLDPMATGVLVLGVGEGTKLVRWLTADDKAYRATLALGAETDTLDADGEVVERVPARGIDLARAREVAGRFVGPTRQRAPVYSAIKLGGESLHAKARRGEVVEAPERDVVVHRLEILAADDAHLELEVFSAKGFYVRALGRDLARALDTRGHLVALRRLASGEFSLADTIDGAVLQRAAAGDEDARGVIRGALLPLASACRGMPRVELGPEAALDAHHGRPVAVPPGAEVDDGAEPIALVDERGELLAVAARRGDTFQVLRGIRVR